MPNTTELAWVTGASTPGRNMRRIKIELARAAEPRLLLEKRRKGNPP